MTPFHPGQQPEDYEESVDSDDASSESEDNDEPDDYEELEEPEDFEENIEDHDDIGSDGLIDLGYFDDVEDPEDGNDFCSDNLTDLEEFDDVEDSEDSEVSESSQNTENNQYTESVEGSENSSDFFEVTDGGDTVVALRPGPKFHLSPAILRTCHKIYKEALPVLYRSNRFVVGMFLDKVGQSPIMRGRSPDWRFPRAYDVDTVPGFKRIRHWRVIIRPAPYTYAGIPPSGLLNFCRALCDSNIESLEVWVIRDDIKMLKHELHINKNGLVNALQPLDLLRNLTSLDIKEVNKYYKVLDLPKLLQSGVEWPGKPTSAKRSSIILDETKSRLQRLTQGDSFILRLFRSLAKLITYVKTFESNDKHKARMVQPLAAARLFRDTAHWPWHYRFAPLKEPLRDLLCFAIVAGVEDDIEEFRDTRAEVANLLEPQYQRMVVAVQDMERFNLTLKVKAWEEGLHSVNHASTCLAAKARVKLWAIQFERDRLSGRRGYIKADPPVEIVTVYASLLRQKLFKKMGKLEIDLQSIRRCKRYMRLFREVAVHLHSQYLEARKAKDALFDSDDFETEEENVSRPYVDWMMPNTPINWTIPRPMVDPRISLTIGRQHDNNDEVKQSGIGEQRGERDNTKEESISSDGRDDDEPLDFETFQACKNRFPMAGTVG